MNVIFRTGFGFDVHRLAEGGKMILGGVTINSAGVGTVAHSDGDVLVHALCDALLGGAGLADIGTYFPDTDPTFSGADSMVLLDQVMGMLRERACSLVNVDATVVLERPKLSEYREEIRDSLASRLGLKPERVAVKATTHERMGPFGKGEGIASYVSVMLSQRTAG